MFNLNFYTIDSMQVNFSANDNSIYCKHKTDFTIHILLDCPYTANLWRSVELWLRKNIDATTKISEKEKIFGLQERC